MIMLYLDVITTLFWEQEEREGGREGGRGERRKERDEVLVYVNIDACFYMRDEKEERKKQARSTRQSNTAHPRQSLFLEKMSCLRWDSNPRHSIL